MAIRYGSWGTPEFGATEWLSDLFNQGRTQEGGSNIYGPAAQTTLAPVAGTPGAFQTTNVTGVGLQPTQSLWTSAPVQQTQQQPQQPSGGTSREQIFRNMYGPNETMPPGWNPPGTSGGGGVPQGPSEADISAIYNPAFQTLSAQEAAFRAELPGAEQKIGTSYAEGLSLIDRNLATQEAALAKQGATITSTKANALSQARQLYSELSQKYGAMFGSRTSAGPFAMELLGRETQKQFGAVEQGATTAQQDVEGERNRLTSWVSDQKSTMLSKKTDALNELQRSFTTGLAQIMAQRGQLESAKASMRVDLLNKARSEAQAIEQASVAYERNLALFQQQKQASLDQMQYARQLQGYTAEPFRASQIGATSTQGGTTGLATTAYVGQRSGDYVFNGTAWVYQPA